MHASCIVLIYPEHMITFFTAMELCSLVSPKLFFFHLCFPFAEVIVVVMSCSGGVGKIRHSLPLMSFSSALCVHGHRAMVGSMLAMEISMI